MKIPRHIKTASIGSKILYYSFIHYVLITRHVCTDDAFHIRNCELLSLFVSLC